MTVTDPAILDSNALSALKLAVRFGLVFAPQHDAWLPEGCDAVCMRDSTVRSLIDADLLRVVEHGSFGCDRICATEEGERLVSREARDV